MTTDLPLGRTPVPAFIAALRGDLDPVVIYHALTCEISSGLSPAHAAILAEPRPTTGGFEWFATGVRAIPADSLPAAGRAALMAALGSILADMAALAQRGGAPVLAAAWPMLRLIPDTGFIHAIDGRPVIAGWGFHAANAADHDPLASIMPPEVTVAPPIAARRHFGPIAAALLATALVIGFCLPGIVWQHLTCVLPAATAANIAEGNQAFAQNAQLATQLAQLEEQAAKQKAQCPGPLPAQAWNQGSLPMLKGCWHLVSSMTLYDQDTHEPYPVQTWLICFDDQGKGTQNVTYTNGQTCSGPLKASFDDQHQMIVSEPEPCLGTGSIVPQQFACDRQSDVEATCTIEDVDEPHHSGQSGVFQR